MAKRWCGPVGGRCESGRITGIGAGRPADGMSGTGRALAAASRYLPIRVHSAVRLKAWAEPLEAALADPGRRARSAGLGCRTAMPRQRRARGAAEPSSGGRRTVRLVGERRSADGDLRPTCNQAEISIRRSIALAGRHGRRLARGPRPAVQLLGARLLRIRWSVRHWWASWAGSRSIVTCRSMAFVSAARGRLQRRCMVQGSILFRQERRRRPLPRRRLTRSRWAMSTVSLRHLRRLIRESRS